MAHMGWLAAESAAQSTEQLTTSAIIWSLVLICFVLIAFAGVGLIRRWLQRSDPTEPGGFTLGDLRQLQKAGKITLEEFERAKAQVLATIRRDNPPGPPKGEKHDDGGQMPPGRIIG